MILYKSCCGEQHTAIEQVWSLKTEQRVSNDLACKIDAEKSVHVFGLYDFEAK